MSGTLFATAVTAEAIEAAFDGRWGIWLSDTGRWWAARQEMPGEPGAAGQDAAWQHTAGQDAAGVLLVRADDPDQLKARIVEQESLPGRAARSLVAGKLEGCPRLR
jgi:hypothetical protein